MKRSVILLTAGIVFEGIFPGEAETLMLKTERASCRIETEGARVVSYVQDGQEVLWNDTPPQLSAKDWAHGGLPICWPWFGDDGQGNLHGVAWRRSFKRGKRWATDGVCGQELSLREGDLHLVYSIILRDGLLLEAEVKNCGATNCAFTIGFHPYFRAAERDLVTVAGVSGRKFEDDPSFPKPQRGVWSGDLRVTNYVDRIFALKEKREAIRVRGTIPGRTLELACEGFAGLNVWNPGAEKNCAGVLPGDCWRRFVCVEPVRCSPSGTIKLAPGEIRKFHFSCRIMD